MISVLNLSRSHHGLSFASLSHAEARAYLVGDGSQKELLCCVALMDEAQTGAVRYGAVRYSSTVGRYDNPIIQIERILIAPARARSCGSAPRIP
jgi:hypothetical protein